MTPFGRLLLTLSLASCWLMSACGDDGPASGDLDVANLDDTSEADGTGEIDGLTLPDGETPDVSPDVVDDVENPLDGSSLPDAEDGTDDSDEGSSDAADGSSENGCRSTECDIDGVCVANLEANPDTPCEACIVVVSRTSWSANDDAPCDDGDPCTLGELCFEGACSAPLRECDDGNACTAGTCSAETGECEFVPAEGACDDANACTLDDLCAAGTCAPGTPRSCDDGNPCTADSCDPELGCVFTALSDVACDDGEVCTTGDACVAGVCQGGGPTDCDDDSLCTVDRCVPGIGCDYEDLTPLCVDDNPCTDETCDGALGCVYPFNTDPCDDTNFCTDADTCFEGACLGTAIDPDDINSCTNDSCDPAVGPVYVNNTFVCDDLNACTVGDVCADGSCEPGTTPLACDDGDVCTDDFCDPTLGCDTSFNTDPCTDNSVCTIDDTCGDGTCSGETISCDDGNACTADACDAVTGCSNTLIVSDECRPTILVTYPPRGASIQADASDQITVTGRVFSGAGPITEFTLNGQTVSVNPADGSFSFDSGAAFGNNILVFEAADSFGSERRRVQSYLWAETWFDPRDEDEGVVADGLGLVLGQSAFDKLAGLFGGFLGSLDFASLLGADPAGVLLQGQSRTFLESETELSQNRTVNGRTGERLTFLTAANEAGIDLVVFLREQGTLAGGVFTVSTPAIATGTPTVALTIVDGGLRLNATIPNLVLQLRIARWGLLSFAIPEVTDVRATSITIATTARINVVDGALEVVFDPSTVGINGVSSSNGIVNLVAGGLVGGLAPTIEDALDAALGDLVGDTLAGALGALALSLPLDLPALNPGGEPISVNLTTEFADISLVGAQSGTPGSAAFFLDANATASTVGSSFIDVGLGAPSRGGCGFGEAQTLSLLRRSEVELGLQDDTLTRVLYAAWASGLLEQPIPASLLGDVDLSEFGVESLELELAAMLPPALSDCADVNGDPLLQVGDLRIDAVVGIFGVEIPLVIFASAEVRLGIDADPSGVGIYIREIERIEVEVSTTDPAQVSLEPVLLDLIETQLLPGLLGSLGGDPDAGPLFSFALPEIDLGGISPDFAGVSLIIETTSAERISGTNLISGALTGLP
jgi:hypothetical protein